MSGDGLTHVVDYGLAFGIGAKQIDWRTIRELAIWGLKPFESLASASLNRNGKREGLLEKRGIRIPGYGLRRGPFATLYYPRQLRSGVPSF